MQTALTWLMTGPAPQERSGDATERSAVSFIPLTTFLDEMGRLRGSIDRLGESLRADSAQRWRDHEEFHRRESDALARRLGSIEVTENQRKLKAARDEGKWAFALFLWDFVAKHHVVLYPIALAIIGTTWAIVSGGHPSVGVQP